MSEYLTKEEIKQWRSSLEKITLEEYAARLGKQIEETKKTNDIVDIVLKGKPYTSYSDMSLTKTERIASIAERSIEREHEIVSEARLVEPTKKVKKETPKQEPKPVEKAVKEVSVQPEKPIIEISETECRPPQEGRCPGRQHRDRRSRQHHQPVQHRCQEPRCYDRGQVITLA